MKRPLSINITTARKKKGWSQEATARKIGVKRSRYAKWEEGTKPDLDMMAIILEIFGISDEDTRPFIWNENFWE
jgi:transcriptional regulator with XRE-family HTH domain